MEKGNEELQLGVGVCIHPLLKRLSMFILLCQSILAGVYQSVIIKSTYQKNILNEKVKSMKVFINKENYDIFKKLQV